MSEAAITKNITVSVNSNLDMFRFTQSISKVLFSSLKCRVSNVACSSDKSHQQAYPIIYIVEVAINEVLNILKGLSERFHSLFETDLIHEVEAIERKYKEIKTYISAKEKEVRIGLMKVEKLKMAYKKAVDDLKNTATQLKLAKGDPVKKFNLLRISQLEKELEQQVQKTKKTENELVQNANATKEVVQFEDPLFSTIEKQFLENIMDFEGKITIKLSLLKKFIRRRLIALSNTFRVALEELSMLNASPKKNTSIVPSLFPMETTQDKSMLSDSTDPASFLLSKDIRDASNRIEWLTDTRQAASKILSMLQLLLRISIPESISMEVGDEKESWGSAIFLFKEFKNDLARDAIPIFFEKLNVSLGEFIQNENVLILRMKELHLSLKEVGPKSNPMKRSFQQISRERESIINKLREKNSAPIHEVRSSFERYLATSIKVTHVFLSKIPKSPSLNEEDPLSDSIRNELLGDRTERSGRSMGSSNQSGKSPSTGRRPIRFSHGIGKIPENDIKEYIQNNGFSFLENQSSYQFVFNEALGSEMLKIEKDSMGLPKTQGGFSEALRRRAGENQNQNGKDLFFTEEAAQEREIPLNRAEIPPAQSSGPASTSPLKLLNVPGSKDTGVSGLIPSRKSSWVSYQENSPPKSNIDKIPNELEKNRLPVIMPTIRDLTVMINEQFIFESKGSQKDGMLIRGTILLSNYRIVFHSFFNNRTLLFGRTLVSIPLVSIRSVEHKKSFWSSSWIHVKTVEKTEFVFNVSTKVEILLNYLQTLQRIQSLEYSVSTFSDIQSSIPEENKEFDQNLLADEAEGTGFQDLERRIENLVQAEVLQAIQARASQIEARNKLSPSEYEVEIYSKLFKGQQIAAVATLLNPKENLSFKDKSTNFYEILSLIRDDFSFTLDSSGFREVPTFFLNDNGEGASDFSTSSLEPQTVKLVYVKRLKEGFMMPKSADVDDQSQVFFVSHHKISIVSTVNISKVPYSDCFSLIYLLNYTQTKNGVLFLVKLRFNWKKSTVFKSKIEKATIDETRLIYEKQFGPAIEATLAQIKAPVAIGSSKLGSQSPELRRESMISNSEEMEKAQTSSLLKTTIGAIGDVNPLKYFSQHKEYVVAIFVSILTFTIINLAQWAFKQRFG